MSHSKFRIVARLIRRGLSFREISKIVGCQRKFVSFVNKKIRGG